jgi:hypothetical protein
MLFLKTSFTLVCLLLLATARGQYAPAAGQAGSTAISKDSIIIAAWATQVSVQRGWQDASDHSKGKVSYGTESDAKGKADNSVISLGDGGIAVVQFARPLSNGPGPDFAVFENSFDDFFLELAFVEVSSDGQNYFRFPAHSLTQTQTQIGTFGKLNCTKLHNLAGKYRGGYGTPFDLDDLKNQAGLDVMKITHIRIIDVVGSIDTLYGTRDSAGNMVNDPFPTAFPSGGFDLDAVGAIHLSTGIHPAGKESDLRIYPNPARDKIRFQHSGKVRLTIYSMQGKILYQEEKKPESSVLDIGFLSPGTYIVEIQEKEEAFRNTLIKLP